jgi:hypothetical protein
MLANRFAPDTLLRFRDGCDGRVFVKKILRLTGYLP